MVVIKPTATETVTVVYIDDQNRCIAETQDNFHVPIGQCNTRPDDRIEAEFDVKIKERWVQSIRRL